ncbi:hypothetical protein AK830_g57 [Neonectria ditissima]|uniref:Uncharacterized protein n=1 Tax=Neonectria ditissima TaxID=78410 RepID=A0A0P7BXX9_9HYPO|nr:hypothetical protein AK830_g57 [Neonectria ditissima]
MAPLRPEAPAGRRSQPRRAVRDRPRASQAGRGVSPRAATAKLRRRTSPRPRRREEPFTRAAVRLSLQAHPNLPAVPIELRIAYQGTQPRAADARIQLSSLPSHSPRPPKRPLPGQDEAPSSKRPHIHDQRPQTPPDPPAAAICVGEEANKDDDEGEKRWQDCGQTLPSPAGRIHRALLRSPRHAEAETRPLPPPRARYAVNLGVVKAFPAIPNVELSPFETGLASNGSSGATQTDAFAKQTAERDSKDDLEDDIEEVVDHLDKPPQRTPRLVLITAIITVLALVLSPCLLISLTLTDHRKPASEPDAFEAVDWFQQAVMIHVGTSVAMRMLLLGETHLEKQRWRCQPGLRTPEGTFYPIDRPPPDTPNFTCCPGYKPWETSSNGTYIEERIFLGDIDKVLYSTAMKLERIANHGPFEFRFTNGTSTQFRWSTFKTGFVGPHASLPTIDTSLTNHLETTTTVHGMATPSSNDTQRQPTPTARPEYVFFIYNLDPPLAKLLDDTRDAFRRFRAFHEFEYADLTAYHLRQGFIDLDCIGRKLRRLKWRASQEENWGSDHDRFRCVYQPSRPENMTVDLTKPESSTTPRKRPQMTDIPQDISHEFISAVWKAESSRKVRSRSWESEASQNASASSTKPFTPIGTPCPTGFPSLADWSANQKQNGTAKELLKILDTSLKFDFEPGNDFEPGKEYRGYQVPQFHNIVLLRDRLIAVCDLMDDFVDRIEQVVRGLPLEKQVNDPFDPYLTSAWRNAAWLHDVVGFFRDIAVVRLKEMRERFKRSAWLIEELERQQRELRDEIDRGLMRGWRGHRNQALYIPAIHDILDVVDASYRWAEEEANGIYRVALFRGADFDRRRSAYWKNILTHNHADRDIFWSRWGLRDRRRDPEGSEALCYSVYPMNVSYDYFNEEGRRRTQRCGDAWARHGYDDPRHFEYPIPLALRKYGGR